LVPSAQINHSYSSTLITFDYIMSAQTTLDFRFNLSLSLEPHVIIKETNFKKGAT